MELLAHAARLRVHAHHDGKVQHSWTAPLVRANFVVPSLLYGGFFAGEELDARVLVMTFDTSVRGGGRFGPANVAGRAEG